MSETAAPPAGGATSGETPPPQTPPPSQPTPSPTPSPAPAPQTPAPASGSGDGKPKQESASEKRIRELNDAKKAAEAQAAEATRKLQEKERAEMSEIDRLKAEAAEAKQEKEAAESKALKLEREGWVLSAAQEAKFTDPTDAVAHLSANLADLDTETKARNAVKKLAEEKAHLVGSGSQQPPAPGFGNMGGTGQREAEIPTGADGQPDPKLGLGRELLGNLTGRRGR